MNTNLPVPMPLSTVDGIVGPYLNNRFFETTAQRESLSWGTVVYTVTSNRYGDAGRVSLEHVGNDTNLVFREPSVPFDDRTAWLREHGREHPQLALQVALIDGLLSELATSVYWWRPGAPIRPAELGGPVASSSVIESEPGWKLLQEYTFDGEADEVCQLFGDDPADPQLHANYANVMASGLGLPLTNVRYVLLRKVTGVDQTGEHKGVGAIITLAQERREECIARLYLAPRGVWESDLGGADKVPLFVGAFTDNWNRKMAEWRAMRREQQLRVAQSPAAAGERAKEIVAGSGLLREEGLIKEISLLFRILRGHAEDMSIAGLYDFHVIAQDFIAKLLNMMFGWQLVNMDYLHKNQPGIDLGDRGNCIAVQVTAERERSKIQETIDLFIEHELHQQYRHLYFFILTGKRRHQKPFNTRGYFLFAIDENILDFSDLLRNIRPKPIGALAEIRRFLAEEITVPLESGSTSPLVLQELLDELPTIETLAFHDGRFQVWHTRVRQALRQVFGKNSDEVMEYAKIAWNTSNDPADATEQQGLYTRSCKAARGLLQGWILNARGGTPQAGRPLNP